MGGEGFALEKLLCACPDFAFTSARLNAIATDAEKKNALAPVVNLLANLGGRVVAAEIENDDELREYRARDIFGFVPGAGYAGRLNVHLETIALERLIEKSAAEEDFSLSPSERVESESEPREDLTSSVNSVDSFPEGEAEGFGEKATEGEAKNKAEQSEVNGND